MISKPLFTLSFLLYASLATSAPSFGEFSGHPHLEWLDDGRDMKLLQEFTYTDPGKQKWQAPSGATINGASIPPLLWSFVGGPYEGKYRNASIVHDTECQSKQHEWRLVHRMFYNASRASGVRALKARFMYAAVYQFGPRWDKPKPSIASENAKDYLERLLVQLQRDKSKPVTLDDIEQIPYEILKQNVKDTDKDLLRVRELLAARCAIEQSATTSKEYTDGMRKIDDELFPEALDDTSPRIAGL